MNVLVDTSIWSLTLRRNQVTDSVTAEALRLLLQESRCRIIGPIRQELLSGISSPAVYERLKTLLSAFPDETLTTTDYEDAALFSNRCRVRGIQGSPVDFLICAVAYTRGWSIFTADKDFSRYAPILGLHIHYPGG